MSEKENTYDIVVFGATSFVGQLLCRYLGQRHGADGELKWAAAGRSQAKLEAVRGNLDLPDLPLLVADATDNASLNAMCKQARVVISTVGPYALYGEPLVRACAESGTDYCDLTGEVQWIREMIRKYESAAKKSGARIVHCCGFDSLPSDLGVHFLQKEARKRFDVPCTKVNMRVKRMRGGFSGGTVASMTNLAKQIRKDPALRKAITDPYALCPEDYRPSVRQPTISSAQYDEEAGSWTAPFLMGAINERIVQRSNALSGQAYGESFRYGEAMMTGGGAKGRMRALSVAAGMGGFLVGVALAPTRALLERFVLPSPGEGPSPESQEKGFYDIRFFGRTDRDETLRAKVVGDRDPGYGSTSKMLGEAGACLAQDVTKQQAGGFWTPATLMGDPLIARLKAHAGVTFDILD